MKINVTDKLRKRKDEELEEKGLGENIVVVFDWVYVGSFGYCVDMFVLRTVMRGGAAL